MNVTLPEGTAWIEVYVVLGREVSLNQNLLNKKKGNEWTTAVDKGIKLYLI